ncbi:hypothetical protein D0T25_10020 [Duganella sp. BJB488]|uniref:hypothetical protein n=1 Tax=unclassified Duganella TaxID=2636909 RepID=UPI000E34729F|nr:MULTISPECIES: hypothetical protein [unclassified Duganella]NVD74674.1 hypothetical protein [Duganella sp. BJB1802]RFP21585.1 hypothetical protein D0T26_10060 [Duganella sp. BJB489]RFP23378.1 hypothetical protein D0T25_10020 [Duganella sp. BJB488]RFP38544.1 hypothetical protein D0T24_02865 [Duganella sp. BJB480]
MGIFSRRRKPAIDIDGLGVTLVALRLDAGDSAPVGSTVVVFNAGGHARRAPAGKVACEQGETVLCFHPGPYTVHLAPFASAPEWGLRLRFVVDAANPRVTQQRFDLYLYSEMAGRLELETLRAAAQAALQTELAQGALDLPPCTTMDEWHAFRAGLNQLMYTRFGLTVDDCVPVDLGDQVDYAEVLKARAAVEAAVAPPPVENSGASSAQTPRTAAPVAQASQQDVASTLSAHVQRNATAATPTARQDAFALRRLFIELPSLASELRVLVLPDGLQNFQQHQALLLRLGMAALNVNTMPALAWAAPDQPLAPEEQARRTVQTLLAVQALDEAWALLARFQRADHAQWPALLEDADRICANLETGLAFRRAPHAPRAEPSL